MEVLGSKLDGYPAGCVVIIQQSQVVGYALSYPYTTGRVPSLHTTDSSSDVPNGYFLHELSIAPTSQRQGLGQLLLHYIISHAQQQGYTSIDLVSVNGSLAWWKRQGCLTPSQPPLDYGSEAVFLSLPFKA
jgi:ribosomal protein S18 acetylase RimI-like enzyme